VRRARGTDPETIRQALKSHATITYCDGFAVAGDLRPPCEMRQAR
jgi:hypothetical protein